MPLYYVTDGSTTYASVVWVDARTNSDAFVFCQNTGMFHANGNMTHSYYTKRGPYYFNEIEPGQAGVLIQSGCGWIDPNLGLLRSYLSERKALSVRRVLLTAGAGV